MLIYNMDSGAPPQTGKLDSQREGSVNLYSSNHLGGSYNQGSPENTSMGNREPGGY